MVVALTLRIDLKAMTFMGLPVKLNDTFRLGAFQARPPLPFDPEGSVTCSTASWSHLLTEQGRGGVTPALDAVEMAVGEAVSMAKVKMIDLSFKGPTKVVDRRRVTRYSDDRVDYICRGISDLVSQMSTLSQMPGRSDGSVASVAKRYAELASEMKELRTLVANAEGMFEVAQQQVVNLMAD